MPSVGSRPLFVRTSKPPESEGGCYFFTPDNLFTQNTLQSQQLSRPRGRLRTLRLDSTLESCLLRDLRAHRAGRDTRFSF